jgi:hypothetical protein
MSENNIDIASILFRLEELEAKARELDALKAAVKDITALNDIGLDVANDVANDVAKDAANVVSEVDALRDKDINIPFLQKKANAFLFKRRGGRGLSAKPLLESEILDVQKITNSARQAAYKLGVSYPTYRKYCKLYGVFKTFDKTDKRPNICPVNPYKGKYPVSKILEGEYPEFPIHRLKDKLIRAGLKSAECEQCGYKERRLSDGKLPLLLNFEDDNRKNHKIENLKILCYNCTFVCGRGYIKRGPINVNMDPDILQGAKFPFKPRF